MMKRKHKRHRWTKPVTTMTIIYRVCKVCGQTESQVR
jgi:hypothetical protein